MSCLKNLFTETDNETLCPVRVGGGFAGLFYHAGLVAGLYMGDVHLDIATLGMYLQHMVTIMGIGGLSIGAKSIMKGDAQ